MIPCPDDSGRRDDEEATMKAIHELLPPFGKRFLLYYYQGYGIGERPDARFALEGTISSRPAELESIFEGRRGLSQ